MLTAKQIT
jgi:hypothetical protein